MIPMNILDRSIPLAAAVALVALSGPPVFSQPAGPPPDAGSVPPNEVWRNLEDKQALLEQAQTLTANGQYDRALQCFLELYDKAQADQDEVTLLTALPDWIKLGRRYPRARQSLIEIRDRDAREFARVPDTLELLKELNNLNSALGDDTATVALFKDLRQSHPSQAEDWYMFVEPALVQRGEYQLCLDYIGNPQARFNVYRYTFGMEKSPFKNEPERQKEMLRQMAEYDRQKGRPSPPPPPDYLLTNSGAATALKSINNCFVSEVSRLIEILVGTGHHEDGGKNP